MSMHTRDPSLIILLDMCIFTDKIKNVSVDILNFLKKSHERKS